MPTQPIIAILYDKDDWTVQAPTFKPGYEEAYQQLYTAGDARGLVFVRSSMHWVTEKGFERGWTYQRGGWRRVGPFVPTMVWNKTAYRISTLPAKQKLHARFRIVNSLALEQLANDKWLSYMMFQSWMSKSMLVHSTEEASDAVSRFATKKIVLKPSRGTGGKNVNVVDRNELARANVKPFSIVQEFVDTSGGIPGVMTGPHDFRLGISDGKILYGEYRKPKKGSFVANLGRGGTMHSIPFLKIPKSARDIAKEIDAELAPCGPRFYCIDFLFGRKGRPIVVELNSKPGILMSPELQDTLVNGLVDFFARHVGDIGRDLPRP